MQVLVDGHRAERLLPLRHERHAFADALVRRGLGDVVAVEAAFGSCSPTSLHILTTTSHKQHAASIQNVR